MDNAAAILHFAEQANTLNAEAERFEKLLPPFPLRDAVIKQRRLTAQCYLQNILLTLFYADVSQPPASERPEAQ